LRNVWIVILETVTIPSKNSYLWVAVLFFRSYSCCPLYLFRAKGAQKRMPLPSGLAIDCKIVRF